MHQFLRKQIAKAVDVDGALDIDRLTAAVSATYDDADKDRRRTDRSISLMVEELAQLNERLEAMVASRTAELEATRKTLSATLENVDQGIMMVDADERVQVCNGRAAQLLDFPLDLAEAVSQQISAHEFDEAALEVVESSRNAPTSHHPPLYERRRPNGTFLEVRTIVLEDGGCVRTYTDGKAVRKRIFIADKLLNIVVG